MPVMRIGLRFLREHLTVVLVALFTVAGVSLLFGSEPAKAETIVCLPHPSTLDFGSALEATGIISFRCQNYGNVSRTFSMCGSRTGTVSWPGTVEEPRLYGNNSSIKFNLYTDAQKSQVWSTTNFILSGPVTVPANSAATVNMYYYGRIPAGQQTGESTYQASFYNIRIGFLVSPTLCQEDYNDMGSNDINISVTYLGASACTLGTIEPVDFGQSAGLESERQASGSVQLQCPVGRVWKLTFGTGENLSGSDRRMRNGTGEYITYRLYKDLSHTIQIPVNGTVTGAGTGALYTQPVYGVVNFLNMPTIGSYSDRVIVTLSF